MKLTNRTGWRSDHLRAFVARVALDELDPKHRRNLHVAIEHRHRLDCDGTTGCAYVGSAKVRQHGPTVFVRVPLAPRPVNKVALALIIAHELAHARGLHHRDMRSLRYSWRFPGWRARYAWAEALPLEPQPAKAKPSTEQKRRARLAHALDKQRAWERRAKLATAAARRWRVRVRTLERTLTRAAASTPPPEFEEQGDRIAEGADDGSALPESPSKIPQ